MRPCVQLPHSTDTFYLSHTVFELFHTSITSSSFIIRFPCYSQVGRFPPNQTPPSFARTVTGESSAPCKLTYRYNWKNSEQGKGHKINLITDTEIAITEIINMESEIEVDLKSTLTQL